MLCEIYAASARERELTVSPHASSSAMALTIRACSSARRASASGSHSGVSCGKLVHGASRADTGPASAPRVTTTRPSYRSGRLRCADSRQLRPDERVGHTLHARIAVAPDANLAACWSRRTPAGPRDNTPESAAPPARGAPQAFRLARKGAALQGSSCQFI